jgi:hypothetical protein
MAVTQYNCTNAFAEEWSDWVATFSPFKIGLYTVAPSKSAAGTECTGGGYARIDGTMLARTGGIPGTVWNEVEFDFGTPSVGWGVVVAIGVHKADGTLWFWIPVTPGISCPAGAPVSITTETLIEYIS